MIGFKGLRWKLFLFTMLPFTLVLIVVSVLTVKARVRYEKQLVIDRVESYARLLESGDITYESVDHKQKLEDIFNEEVLSAKLIKRDFSIAYTIHNIRHLTPDEKELVEKSFEGNIVRATRSRRDQPVFLYVYPLVVNKKIVGVFYLELLSKRILDRSRSFLYFVVFLNISALVVSLLMINYFARKIIIKRISSLVDFSKNVAAGDLQVIDDVIVDDEIGQLFSAFNSMTRDLKASREALEEYNRNLENMVQERTAELESAHSQLIQSSKMAAIGQLAAGVAHEINNPTGAIIGNMDTMKIYFERIKKLLDCYEADHSVPADKKNETIDKLKDELQCPYIIAEIPEVIDESLDAAVRIKTIVQNLKTFCYPYKEKYEPSDINYAVEKSMALLDSELRFSCRVEKELSELPDVMGNIGQIIQVIVNITMNAAQAVKGTPGAKIVIRTFVENDFACVAVNDNGPGIPQELREKIFDPFFTTKEAGKGTGLGLSIVYSIVKEHGGIIDVLSEVGKGTTFVVKLPTGGSPDEG